eukprot:COSAG01_NODE_1832_length_9109_cov_67.250721_11_plen_44_part_00
MSEAECVRAYLDAPVSSVRKGLLDLARDIYKFLDTSQKNDRKL